MIPHLTTAQLESHLAELERIVADGRYDVWQVREARRGIKLYRAELAARSL